MAITCDLCGTALVPGKDIRYEVRIQVLAAPDTELPAPPSAKAITAEIRRLLKKMKGKSPEELEDDVYQTFSFNLCFACKKRYCRNPLRPAPRAPRRHSLN